LRKKLYSSLFVVAFLVTIFSSVVIASTSSTVSAILNTAIKFTLNGNAWIPKNSNGDILYPLNYNSTTYLPIRAVAEATGMSVVWDGTTQTIHLDKSSESYDAVLEFPADQYPQVAAHIASAILAGESSICTIDRSGAEQRREASLAGIPTREGFDRDEWPMAMCKEGGAGASVVYIDPSENRGAGSWVGNALEKYQDGTRVKFVVTFGDLDAGTLKATPANNQQQGEVLYRSCAAAREAGAAPLYKGDPGYGPHLDRDGDGVACE
jgi:hypothetical protein